MYKKLSQIALILILCSVSAKAQVGFVKNVSNKGTVAAAFLEISVNARAEAMGGAYTAQSGYGDMIYWNPAGLAAIDGVSASFSNTEWLASTSFNFASASVPLPAIKSVLAGSFTTLGVPEQDVRNYDGSKTGERYDARDFAVNISLSSQLIESFSFGVTAKYVNQRIWSESATGVAFDFGVLYHTPVDGLTLGTSISNFGDDIQMSGKNLTDVIDPDINNQGVTNIPITYDTEEYPLPQIFRFGLAYQKQLKDFDFTTALDLIHPTGSTESMNLGTEFGFKKLVFFRAGYQNLFERDQINGLTLGGGLQYMLSSQERFTFDYSWSDWGVLGKAHRISMSIYL